MAWSRDSCMEAAAKTYSSTGSAVVSAASSVVVSAVSVLPPQAVRDRASERARSREKNFFMGDLPFFDNLLKPARRQSNVIFK